ISGDTVSVICTSVQFTQKTSSSGNRGSGAASSCSCSSRFASGVEPKSRTGSNRASPQARQAANPIHRPQLKEQEKTEVTEAKKRQQESKEADAYAALRSLCLLMFTSTPFPLF